MNVLTKIAFRHILARKRQSLVSLLGIIIGVAFFLAISSMMQGSEKDFIEKLVNNSPHITIEENFRDNKKQPVEEIYEGKAIELRSLQPQTETRGIRGYKQIIDYLRGLEGVRASAVLSGQAILEYAGKTNNLTLNGMIPRDMLNLTTLEENMVEGSIENLISNRNGIIVGFDLVRRLKLAMGDNVTLTASTGQVRTFKIVGIFRTGRAGYDRFQAFTDIKRVQAIMDKSNRANSIIIKLDDPNQALELSKTIETQVGYKSVSWQEDSEDLMNTLAIRNRIMYTVVSAVLLVAAFGIYNIIFTIIMEKQKDIAILKSMGFKARDIREIFLKQGIILGAAGTAIGLPLGSLFMLGLSQIKFKPPGSSQMVNMPLDWSAPQFIVAAAFAFIAAMIASYLPAKKGAAVMPVDILRGGQ